MEKLSGPILKGKYLYLRSVQPEDAQFLFNWIEEGILTSYKPYLKMLCPTPERLKERIAYITGISPRIEIEYFIHKYPEDPPVGLVSLQGIDYINLRAELSLVVRQRPALHLGLEAMWRAVEYAFFNLNIEKLVFLVMENNKDLLDILKRRSLEPEAVLRKEVRMPDGTRSDIYRFAIFPEDLNDPLWTAIKKVLS